MSSSIDLDDCNDLDGIDLWAAQVAQRAELPDQRLNARFGLVLANLAAKSTASIPQASGNAGQAKATYRFFANERVCAEDLLEPLADVTADAVRGQSVILAIQDTTSANYTPLKATAGLGPVNDSETAHGVHIHSTIAALPNGTAVGLLGQSYWVRPSDGRSAPERRQRAIEDKESRKWLDGIEAAENAVAGLPADERPRLIHIMDREGDVHEVLQRVSETTDAAIIRCAQNRRVASTADGVGDDEPAGVSNAYAALAAAPVIATMSRAVPQPQTARKQRQATLELRAVPLTLTPNPKRHPQRQTLTWTLVEAREVNAPPGVEPLHWRLWTNLPATTLEQVVDLLRWYGVRWRIEDFHLTLKSGCQAEKLALEGVDRLIKALVVYSAVAIRVVSLRDRARTEPNAPCTVAFSRDEWQVLHVHVSGKKLLPTTRPPTLKQAVLWVGRLGGHMGRKRDGMPGVRTLWRGLCDLNMLVIGFRAGRAMSDLRP